MPVRHISRILYPASIFRNAPNFTYTRRFAHTDWQPLYVPFAMKSADWTAQGLEVACINNFHEYEQADGSTKVVLEVKKVTTGMLRPNTPYLIRAIEAGDKTITLSDVELAEPANNTIDCASTLFDNTCSVGACAVPSFISLSLFALLQQK